MTPRIAMLGTGALGGLFARGGTPVMAAAQA